MNPDFLAVAGIYLAIGLGISSALHTHSKGNVFAWVTMTICWLPFVIGALVDTMFNDWSR